LSFGGSDGPEPAILVVSLFLAIAFCLASNPSLAWRWVARSIATLVVVDILVYNAAVVFVSGKPRNILRTLVFAAVALMQLTMAFAVIYASPTRAMFEKSGIDGAVFLNRFESWYFSVVTFATFGPGDIHPALRAPYAWKAELLMTFEILAGLYFLAAVLATFVSWGTPGAGLPSLKALVSESDDLAKSTETYAGETIVNGDRPD
jgi:hypothetical protein